MAVPDVTMTTMTSDDLKRVFTRYQDLLTVHCDAINALNVYPVPDGDTGSNLLATVRHVNLHLEAAISMSDVRRAISDGSLRGASGNSGLILSLILRGFASSLGPGATVGTQELAAGFLAGARGAYAQVGSPLEGTILTVAREAAEEASHASQNGTGPGDFLGAVYRRSVDALNRTPDLLPVLRQAGVVDAGGVGVVLLLAAFVVEQTGFAVSLPDNMLAMSADLGSIESSDAGAVSDLRYEVMFFLDAPDARSRRSASRGRRSVTRSWSSVVTASGTATSTPITSERRSRRESPRVRPGRSRSPISSTGQAITPRGHKQASKRGWRLRWLRSVSSPSSPGMASSICSRVCWCRAS
jgi:dihydroxyacetone kinase-like predicted kinase